MMICGGRAAFESDAHARDRLVRAGTGSVRTRTKRQGEREREREGERERGREGERERGRERQKARRRDTSEREYVSRGRKVRGDAEKSRASERERESKDHHCIFSLYHFHTFLYTP